MRALSIVLLSLSCAPVAEPSVPIEVKIALADGDDSCSEDLLDSMDGVRLFANDVSTTCISISAVDSIAELEEELQNQAVELPAIEDETGTLTVLGYDSNGCEVDDEAMCGQSAFTLPDDDTITVPLFCVATDPSQAVQDCLAAAP